MRRARLMAIGIAVLVGAAATAGFILRAPAVLDVPAPAPPAASPAVVAPVIAAAPVSAAVPVPVEPAPAAPLPQSSAEDFTALLRRARAGDVQAMSELGTALLPCSAAGQAQRVAQLRDIESEDASWGDEGGDLRKEMLNSVRQGIAYCAEMPAEERERGFVWIEAAATAGDAKARYMFFRRALSEFDDEAAIVANIDEVERRRDLARRFAREDLAACVDRVFDTQIQAFDLLGMTDPVERLALLHAGVLSYANPGEASSLADTFREEASAVDELTLIEAKRRGAAMHAHCAP